MGVLSFATYKKYGALIGFATFYFFSSSILIFMNPFHIYNRVFYDVLSGKYHKINISVAYVSSQAFALGLLLFLFVAFTKREVFDRAFTTLKYFSVVNAVIASSKDLNGATFWGYTFDITFATLFLPFFFDEVKKGNKWDLLCILVIYACALYRHPNTPLVMIALAMTLYYLSTILRYALPALFVASSFVSYVYVKAEPGHLIERVYVWEKILPKFFVLFSPWIGAGTGSYRIVGPLLQEDTENVFYFAHNEYLQTFIEQGLIGLVFLFAIIYFCWKKVEDRATKISLILLLVCSFVQYPLHVGVSFLFVLMIVRKCIEGRSYV